jgi:hypothetical protein
MSEKIIKGSAATRATAKKVVAAGKPAVKKTPATLVAAVKAAPVKATATPEKKNKKGKKSGNKVKVVRDSFTMPQNDYAKIGELKQLCLKSGMHVKKSELLRAGLNVLSRLSAAQLKATVSALETIKTGRPKKD